MGALNGNILDLLVLADKYAWSVAKKKYDAAGDLNWKWEDAKNEKFAELLIKECIDKAKSVGDLRGVNDDIIYGADIAALQISKHFEVE